jgi:hypothetical protein
MSTLSIFRETAVDTIKDHAAAHVEETEHLIVVKAREKWGEVLSSADSSLNPAEQASSRFSFMKPIHQWIKKTSDKIKQKKEENQEESENEKEALAWSTIGRIGTGKIMKTTLAAEAAVEGATIASSGLGSFFSSESPQNTSEKSDSSFKFSEALKNIKLPHLRLPDIHLPHFDGLPSFTSTNTQSSYSVHYPDISFPELPELGLPKTPDLSLPSLPSLGQNKWIEKAIDTVVDKVVEKAVDKEQAFIEDLLISPQKEKMEELHDKIVENFGKETEEFLGAAKVIVNHRTIRCQEKIASICSKVRGGIERIHHYTVENLCCLAPAGT